MGAYWERELEHSALIFNELAELARQ